MRVRSGDNQLLSMLSVSVSFSNSVVTAVAGPQMVTAEARPGHLDKQSTGLSRLSKFESVHLEVPERHTAGAVKMVPVKTVSFPASACSQELSKVAASPPLPPQEAQQC